MRHAAHNCGIQILRVGCGWRLVSLRDRFTSFTVTTSLVSWDRGHGPYHARGLTVHFPGTAARVRFDSGSILLVYPSGHIRWITDLGFRYYAVLSQSAPPSHCQGDLVILPLAEMGLLAHRHALSAMLPPDQGVIWCQSHSVVPASRGEAWIEVEEIAVGGNARHQALGHLRFAMPIAGDRRSMQIHTLGEVCIRHDPVDDVHPTIWLPSGRHYLITKLPGFSDPVTEMRACEEILP